MPTPGFVSTAHFATQYKALIQIFQSPTTSATRAGLSVAGSDWSDPNALRCGLTAHPFHVKYIYTQPNLVDPYYLGFRCHFQLVIGVTTTSWLRRKRRSSLKGCSDFPLLKPVIHRSVSERDEVISLTRQVRAELVIKFF